MVLKKIAVFCGYSDGGEPEYLQAAKAMGNSLVVR